MSPQKEPRDWAKINSEFAEIINRHTPGLSETEQNILTQKFIAIVRDQRTHKHTDHINDALTAALKRVPIEIIHKAQLLDQALLAVKKT